jgi:hypothetical protein
MTDDPKPHFYDVAQPPITALAINDTARQLNTSTSAVDPSAEKTRRVRRRGGVSEN